MPALPNLNGDLYAGSAIFTAFFFNYLAHIFLFPHTGHSIASRSRLARRGGVRFGKNKNLKYIYKYRISQARRLNTISVTFVQTFFLAKFNRIESHLCTLLAVTVHWKRADFRARIILFLKFRVREVFRKAWRTAGRRGRRAWVGLGNCRPGTPTLRAPFRARQVRVRSVQNTTVSSETNP